MMAVARQPSGPNSSNTLSDSQPLVSSKPPLMYTKKDRLWEKDICMCFMSLFTCLRINDLSNHKNTFHFNKRNKFHICNRVFNYHGSLGKHIRTVHEGIFKHHCDYVKRIMMKDKMSFVIMDQIKLTMF